MRDVKETEARLADAGFSAFTRNLSEKDVIREATDLWAKDLEKKLQESINNG